LPYSEKYYKGTTTVGMVCTDGIVLASEKRATMEHFIASKDAKKIYKIDDFIGMTTAGAVGDAQRIVRWLSVEVNLYKVRTGTSMTINALSTLLANILNDNRYFPFITQFLVGGMDRGGSRIFSIDPYGGMIEEKKVTSTGSGSPIAYGVLESGYRGDISMEEGVKLAVRAISAAMRRDSASGESIEAVKIGKEGFKEVAEGEIKEISSTFKYA